MSFFYLSLASVQCGVTFSGFALQAQGLETSSFLGERRVSWNHLTPGAGAWRKAPGAWQYHSSAWGGKACCGGTMAGWGAPGRQGSGYPLREGPAWLSPPGPSSNEPPGWPGPAPLGAGPGAREGRGKPAARAEERLSQARGRGPLQPLRISDLRARRCPFKGGKGRAPIVETKPGARPLRGTRMDMRGNALPLAGEGRRRG